jgi:hypothetical protein
VVVARVVSGSEILGPRFSDSWIRFDSSSAPRAIVGRFSSSAAAVIEATATARATVGRQRGVGPIEEVRLVTSVAPRVAKIMPTGSVDCASVVLA